MQACAKNMNFTKENITQHLDWLEKKGLVQRVKDGRLNTLLQVSAGEDLVAELMPIHDE
jgi:DNA-binding MarR family transcriptional regulator